MTKISNYKLAVGVFLKRGRQVTIRFAYGKNRQHEELFGDWPDDPADQQIMRLQAMKKRSIVMREIENNTFNYTKHFPNGALEKKTKHRERKLVFTQVARKAMAHRKLLGRDSLKYREGFEREVQLGFMPYFGDRAINLINEQDIIDYLYSSERCQHISAKFRRDRLSYLRYIFKFAQAEKMIDKNPCYGEVSLKTSKANDPIKDIDEENEIKPFTLTEIQYVIEGAYRCGANELQKQTYRNIVQFAIWSGLRPGEIFGLSWDKVKKTQGEALRVFVDLQCDDKGRFVLPKMAKRRFLDIPTLAAEALESQRKLTAKLAPITIAYHKRAIADPVRRNVNIVFINPNTNKFFLGADGFRYIWSEKIMPSIVDLAARDGITIAARTFYHCRHTFASQLLSAGVPIDQVARYMGHETPAITRKHYAQYIAENTKSDTAYLDMALGQASKS